MKDILIGLLAVVIGALFCFRGYAAMRVVIPVWGAFIGFLVGAAIAASIDNEGLLSTVLGWILGLLFAVVLGSLAYLYYEVSVTIALGAAGFVLGTGAMAALGVDWSWVQVLVGIALGLALAAVAIIADLPALLLVVVTAFAGAATIVAGAMLLAGTIELAELDGTTTETLDIGPWWYVLEVGLAVAGIVAQSRDATRRRLEEAWRQPEWRARV